MKYYKLILNNNIIGVVNSDNFIKFSPVIQDFLISNEAEGEYISLYGKFYRDTWMKPVVFTINFIAALVLEIDAEEYENLKHGLEVEEQMPYTRDETEEVAPRADINPHDTITLEFIRTSKINEMSRTCNQVIEAGFDIELGGKIEHFSLTTQDQLNLISLSSMAANGMEAIPYHADGEICRFYSNAEMQAIVAQATAFKIYHTTYYNALKNYINSLDTIEEIAAVTYGMPLPEEYQSDVLKSLQK